MNPENNGKILIPELFLAKGRLTGKGISYSSRTIASIGSLFEDKNAIEKIPKDTIAYEVASYFPDGSCSPGSLNFGITYMYPVKVGREYVMTKGHFHSNRADAEYYWGIEGEGILLLMDEERNCRAERVFPGSLHYIPGNLAHRMVNTGNVLFSFGACWPSDAGHDYESIEANGFPIRVIENNGIAELKKTDDSLCLQ